MSTPLVSVLIDTYNHERFIEQAIVSVLEQDFPVGGMEILVVDDGSTDSTPSIVQKFSPQVRYLRKENGGQASAFNVGIPETRGEIVAFLDGDDWWAKDKLRVVLEALANKPDFGAVGHGIFETNSESGRTLPIRPLGDCRLRLSNPEEALLFSQLKCFLGTSRVTIRKAVLSQLLPIPEELVVEADEFMFTLAVAIGGAVVLERPLTYYRLHANNLFQFRDGDEGKVRRKREVMSCLARELPPRLALLGVPPNVINAVVKPVWIDAERLRLIFGGGKPWDTFRVERAAYRTAYLKTSLAYRAFKAMVLLSTLLMPPRHFYRAKSWYAAKGLRRLRRVLGEPTPAAPILEGGCGQVNCLICAARQSDFVTMWDQWRIEKCRNCGVFFTDPCAEPSVISLYANGSILGATYEGVQAAELVFPAWKHKEQVLILDRLVAFGVRQGRLLDVGCLWGSFLKKARERGFDVAGVEPFGKAARYVNDILKIPVHQGTLRSVGFGPESFEVVALIDVIEHIPDPVRELQEVHRVTKPDGLLVLNTPNVTSLIRSLVNAKRRMVGQKWCPFDGPPWHLWGFGGKSIKTCVEAAGFQVESVESIESSLRTTNQDAGGALWKRMAFKCLDIACAMFGMSDRMIVFARKKSVPGN